jgi:hypothetical protein
MFFHLKRIATAVLIGHLSSVILYFYRPQMSRFHVVFTVALGIYWMLMKSRARADEQILDVFAIAKMGASKVVSYTALKKMSWAAGNVLYKTSFLDLASPFRSSLSVYLRAAVIFKKDISLATLSQVPVIRQYHFYIQGTILLVMTLLALIYLKYPRENQLLFAILQRNSQMQDRLIKNRARLDYDYFRIMGFEPILRHSVIK